MCITLPWEEQVNAALKYAQDSMASLFHDVCKDAGGAIGAAGSAAYVIGQGLHGSPAEEAVGKTLEGFGGALGLIGTAFYVAGKAGLC